MIDPELKTHLEKIENQLSRGRTASVGTWRSLWRGCVYGAGYVIVVIGWILNLVGIIPAFSNQVTVFRTALERIGGTTK